MKKLEAAPFPDPVISWAGIGLDPRLFWWIAGEPTDEERVVKAGRLDGGRLTELGSVHPVGRRVVVRFSADHATLMVVTGEALHRLALAPGGCDADPLAVEPSIADVGSPDGRTVYLARALSWPPIHRVDTVSSAIEALEAARHDVSKHNPLLSVSPGGRHLAFGHVFDAIELFDLTAGSAAPWPAPDPGKPPASLRDADLIAHLRFTPDGAVLAVSHPRSESPDHPYRLRVGGIDGRDVREFPLPEHLPTVAVDLPGRMVVAARRGASRIVDLLDLEGGGLLDSVDLGERVMGLHLDRRAARLTVVHASGITVMALDRS